MVETRTVIVCGDCGAFWDPAVEQATCTDSHHEHHRFESHLHRSRVVLPDGTEVGAVSFGSADPYARDVSPDFGLYLDERWQPPWPHEHLDWPDFSVPSDPAPVVVALELLLHRARAGQRVEIGCYGGHGRTGTALACLAILCGQAPHEAVDWIRATYCERAVETDEQEAFARNLTRSTLELRVVDGGHPDVASAMRAYFDELDSRFVRGFDPGDAIEAAPTDFNMPRGVFVLAYDDNVIAGCGGLALLDEETAEVKRMWVAPSSRGNGLARRLLQRLEVEASRAGRTRLLLDTNSTLTEAVALYESSGYETIDRYNDNPYAERWFEKRLAPSP